MGIAEKIDRLEPPQVPGLAGAAILAQWKALVKAERRVEAAIAAADRADFALAALMPSPPALIKATSHQLTSGLLVEHTDLIEAMIDTAAKQGPANGEAMRGAIDAAWETWEALEKSTDSERCGGKCAASHAELSEALEASFQEEENFANTHPLDLFGVQIKLLALLDTMLALHVPAANPNATGWQVPPDTLPLNMRALMALHRDVEDLTGQRFDALRYGPGWRRNGSQTV